MFNVITSIDKNSPLSGKVWPGDELLRVNHRRVRDVLDYKYLTYDSRLQLQFKTAGEICVRKGEGEDLGLNFESYLMDSPTGCANRCVFCFVDQLPRGLRSTLYFKDDDARLSFLTGNYITCTNLSEREIQRICDLRISPLNISVHTTNPELRCRLLQNPRGGEIMAILRRFADAGICTDCQIVCVPDWNDGAELQRSMEDLASLYPSVNSVSIVPVGLTVHRQGLPVLRPFDAALAAETISLVETFAEQCLEKNGSRIFFCSDELYLKAGRPLPRDEFYEGYPQLENGVGRMTLLETEFRDALSAERTSSEASPFSIATGLAAAAFMEKLCLLAGTKVHVYGIPNDFFGRTVDVAGLLTGGDLIRYLKGRDLGCRLLIPSVMLRHGEGVFLDDVTLPQLSETLGIPVIPVDCDGAKLLAALRG